MHFTLRMGGQWAFLRQLELGGERAGHTLALFTQG
jgi:hypothetical protein